MKLLVVEDDETTADFLAEQFKKIPRVEAVFAKSRDSAFVMLDSFSFDLVVLDLKLPSTDNALDAEPVHGLAIHAAILDKSRGTPVIVFSGFGTLQLVNELLTNCERHDIFGGGSVRLMTTFKEKSQMAQLLVEVKEFSERLFELNRIEISFGLAPISLSYDEKKILRIFARANRGQNIRITLLGGGLSGAKTCRLEIQDNHKTTSSYAVVKLGRIEDLEREHDGFQRLVSPVIRVGSFAHVIHFVKAGAGGTGGLFYGLAKEHDTSLFDAMRDFPSGIENIIFQLRSMERVWQDGAPASSTTIREIRRQMIDDAAFADVQSLLPFDWRRIEDLPVRIRLCSQHSDLHGLNVLLKNRTEPLLIDFGAVRSAPACLDSLILELSLLFHPTIRMIRGSWPTTAQAQKWDDLSAYLVDCPLPSYVKTCREWSFEVEAGDQGVFATVYAFCVRQLKFPGVDHKLAIAVAESAIVRISAV
jgi:CheY-like chemotaxis protein